MVHGLHDGWNLAVGVAQKFPSLAAPPMWSSSGRPRSSRSGSRMGKSSAWFTSLVSSKGARSDEAIQHRDAGGDMMPVGAALKRSLALRERLSAAAIAGD